MVCSVGCSFASSSSWQDVHVKTTMAHAMVVIICLIHLFIMFPFDFVFICLAEKQWFP